MQWSNNSKGLISPLKKECLLFLSFWLLILITTFVLVLCSNFFFLTLLTFTQLGQFCPLFFPERYHRYPLFPLWLWQQLSGYMGTVAVRGHSGVLLSQHFVCVWGIQTSVEKINATRGRVGLDGNSLLPPPQVCQTLVCQTLACLWWGCLVMSKLLKSALAMKVKACHFGSDDRFHKCSESGRFHHLWKLDIQRSRCFWNRRVSIQKDWVFISCVFRAQKTQSRSDLKDTLCGSQYFVGKNPASWVAFRWRVLCFPRSLILGFIFLAASTWFIGYALKALWYRLLRETLFPAMWFYVELVISSKGFS